MKSAGLIELGRSMAWNVGLMENRTILLSFIFIPVLVIATITDLRTGRIYDRLNYPLMIVSLWISLAEELLMDPEYRTGGLSACVAGGFVCFSLMFLNYIIVGGGGGDVKLATALGMGYGLMDGLNILVLTYLLGAIYIACCLTIDALRYARWHVRQHHGSVSFVARISAQSKLRMGPFFLVSTIMVIAEGFV